jgi:hypothetical protein
VGQNRSCYPESFESVLRRQYRKVEIACCSPSAPREHSTLLNRRLNNTDFRSAPTFRRLGSAHRAALRKFMTGLTLTRLCLDSSIECYGTFYPNRLISFAIKAYQSAMCPTVCEKQQRRIDPEHPRLEIVALTSDDYGLRHVLALRSEDISGERSRQVDAGHEHPEARPVRFERTER